MNSDFDREIDRLLRGGARPRGAGVPTPGNGRDAAADADGAGAHLDADELNAYAENALPEATRTRFVAHLADCDRCRKIAVSVALSSGVAAELERRADTRAAAAPGLAESSAVEGRPAESRPVTWRERLSALLSPRVLRFAAPALAICVVGAVAFVAMRQSPQSLPELARQTGSDTSTNTTAAPGVLEERTATTGATGEQTPPPAANANASANTNSLGHPTSDADREQSPALRQEVGSADASASPPGATAAAQAAPPPPAPVAKAADETYAPAPRDEARKAAPEPVQTEAAPVLKDAPSQQDRDDASRTYAGAANTTNVQSAPRAAPSRRGGGGEEQQIYEQQRSRSNDSREARQRVSEPEREQDGAGRRTMSESRARSRAEGPSAPPATAMRRAPAASEETRSVGGRQFRRQGNAWVDTQYRAQSITTLSRGSEKYRSLVARAPHVDRIARDLPGEVIVVWNGQAYRIR